MRSLGRVDPRVDQQVRYLLTIFCGGVHNEKVPLQIIRHHGVEGALLAGMMAGVLLVLAALARLGRYARCVPASVVEGFAVGVAVVIALQQVPAALGLGPLAVG